MKTLRYPVIVEGKYDQIKLTSLYRANVWTTDGFGIFSDGEKLALFRKLAETTKIILLTDSDGAGTLIRSHLSGAIPADRLIQLYTPQVAGKERRKTKASKAGYLGVEGTDAETLRRLLDPYATDAEEVLTGGIGKDDLYRLGLTGTKDAAAARDRLCRAIALPSGMTPNALLRALNLLYAKEDFLKTAEEILKAYPPDGDA